MDPTFLTVEIILESLLSKFLGEYFVFREILGNLWVISEISYAKYCKFADLR